MVNFNNNNLSGSKRDAGILPWHAPQLNRLGDVSKLTESGSRIGVESLIFEGSCVSPASRAGNNTNQC